VGNADKRPSITAAPSATFITDVLDSFLKLGLEVLRDDCAAHLETVAADKRNFLPANASLCESAAPVSTRKHLFFFAVIMGRETYVSSRENLVQKIEQNSKPT